MEIIGFSSEDMTSIFELLAAILNLGNIEFEGYLLPDETSACKLINAEGMHYNYVISLLYYSHDL